MCDKKIPYAFTTIAGHANEVVYLLKNLMRSGTCISGLAGV